jgi:hypothetical protein
MSLICNIHDVFLVTSTRTDITDLSGIMPDIFLFAEERPE